MDRQRMHRLGRRLMELSRQVQLEPQDERPGPAEELVLGDVMLYPGSTVSDVVTRTGFTQGYVSKCVASLVRQGLLRTRVDDSDRRRTIIEPTPLLTEAAQRRTPPILEVMSTALGDPDAAREALAQLDALADKLLR
jgi:DNA-binding MarR family transcriptional regulator